MMPTWTGMERCLPLWLGRWQAAPPRSPTISSTIWDMPTSPAIAQPTAGKNNGRVGGRGRLPVVSPRADAARSEGDG
jgi:hypothetical protein